MGKKVELKERGTHETLYPVTLTEHIIMPDSSTLTNKLTQIEQKLNESHSVEWDDVIGGSEAVQNALGWYEG